MLDRLICDRGADHRRGANPATALTDCAVPRAFAAADAGQIINPDGLANQLSAVPFSRLLGFFEKYPRLAATIFWSFSCEAAMYAEHLIDVGRRSNVSRISCLNC